MPFNPQMLIFPLMLLLAGYAGNGKKGVVLAIAYLAVVFVGIGSIVAAFTGHHG